MKIRKIFIVLLCITATLGVLSYYYPSYFEFHWEVEHCLQALERVKESIYPHIGGIIAVLCMVTLVICLIRSKNVSTPTSITFSDSEYKTLDNNQVSVEFLAQMRKAGFKIEKNQLEINKTWLVQDLKEKRNFLVRLDPSHPSLLVVTEITKK